MQWERYTEQALKALLRAKDWAVRTGATHITPEHLLLGLVEGQETMAVRLLNEWGVPLDSLPDVLLPKTEPDQVATDQPSMSLSVQRILRRALKEAEALREESVDTAHVLLSLLKERSSAAAKWLIQQGVRYEDLRRRLYELKTAELGEPFLSLLPEDFVADWTEKALGGEVQPIAFWQDACDRLKRILLCRDSPNPVLLGDWETACLLLQQFAYELQFGSLPAPLAKRSLLAIDWAGLWRQQQDFQRLLVELLTEVQRIEPQPLLFLGNLWETLQRAEFLLVAIAQGHCQGVAVLSQDRWDEFAQRHPSLAAAFRPLIVPEPDEAATLEWLKAHRTTYEESHRVTIAPEALQATVQLALPLASEKPLLVVAKRLLDEACAFVRCQVLTPPQLRRLEDEMERLQGEMRRLLRTGEREQLSVLMERAIVLQTQIEALREQFRTQIPQVTAATIQSVAQQWQGLSL